MVAIGDVVSVRQLAGQIWAVLGLVDKAIRPGGYGGCEVSSRSDTPALPGRHAGDGDLTVIAHPTFEIGQLVNYDAAADGTAEVIVDNGDTVRIRVLHVRPQSRSAAEEVRVRTPQICESDVERGDLVAENL